MSYDIAQICLNGHVINRNFQRYHELNKQYCPYCGEPTIIECLKCHKHIKGEHEVKGVVAIGFKFYAPKFCEYCGAAFPWTQSTISAAKELVAGLNAFSEEQKRQLAEDIEVMIKDTPRTVTAAVRFKDLFELVYGEVLPTLRTVLTGVLSKTALDVLGWEVEP